MSKFTQICQAAALALALSASAQASQTFNFTFSDVSGSFDGTSSVSGEIILDGDGDGTFASSSVIITSAPSAMINNIRSGDLNFDVGTYRNTFTVFMGNIVDASFFRLNISSSNEAVLAFNALGYDGYFGTNPYALADAAGGVNSVIFSSAAAAVPEPSTLALFLAGAGLMGASARRRRAAAKIA